MPGLLDETRAPPLGAPFPPSTLDAVYLRIVWCWEVQSAKAMTGVDSNAFSLNVETVQLKRALKRHCKTEPRDKVARIEYDSGTLTISIGPTSEGIPASGTWPHPVAVGRTWARTFALQPFGAAITVLRQADGWLHTRDNKMRCSLEPWTEDGEVLGTGDEDITAAHRILGRYKITKREVSALIKAAEPRKAWLWGPNDGPLIDAIALIWMLLAIYGLEPSDVRSLIDRKSRELWKSGRKAGSLFERYNVTEEDERALIESGDLTKAKLWGRNGRLLEPIIQAWKHLVLYGVEPSDIVQLIERKSR